MKDKHPQKAATFIKDEARVDWHDAALWHVRSKRDLAVDDVPEWAFLRGMASEIKSHTLSKLDSYLLDFEANALKNGVTVHWARDGEEHNSIVLDILQKNNATKVVKSKSMLTEECELNPYLEAAGIEVTDTDLGERIIQLRKEPPSHIVLPAIHIKKEEVGDLFRKELNSEPGNNDPTYLTHRARAHLREKFLECDAAITGVNFGIAETGEVIVCTNEGNADMGVHLAKVQIHSMGLEKMIPRKKDLGIFIRLLARSATGQPITIYTSHHKKAIEGTEKHIILVDNGRSDRLAMPDYRNALKCIRCGACMNTCPIYRRSGGHSYHFTIPGPIGSILAPTVDTSEYSDLPFASTLCGSCEDVCPVKIDIPHQLYKWRQDIAEAGNLSAGKRRSMRLAARILKREKNYKRFGKLMNIGLKYSPKFLLNNRFNKWSIGRDLPKAPKESFKSWYKKNHGK